MSRPRRIVFAVLALLALFGVAELALRGLGFRYDDFFAQSFWWTRFSKNPIYERDRLRFWRLRPHANSELDPHDRSTQLINGLGFRDDPFSRAKQPGEWRAIALGDSCTFGDGVANWETYANELEKLARAAMPDRPVQVINAGVPGYTSYQVRTYLENELLAYEPDVVIVYVGFNDNVPATGGVPDATRGPTNPLAWTLQGWLSHVRLYQALQYIIVRLRRRTAAAPTESTDGEPHHVFRVPHEDFIANLKAIADLGARRDIAVFLVTLPHRFASEPERNPFIRQAARQSGNVVLVDLFGALKRDQAAGMELYCADGGHPNVSGHKRIAEEIFQAMREQGVIRNTRSPE